MDDKNILQHLLDLEKQAAALVDEAQAEADRRMSEGEKKYRIRCDEFYTRELEALEKSYAENNTAVKESYQKQLEEYRESLKTQAANPANSACSVNPVYRADQKAFNALAEKYLIGTGSLSREN